MLNQFLATGGIWLGLNGTEILLDPGPGCLVHAIKRKLVPKKLSAIIVSHRHLDHSADTNIMVEAMTQGGFYPRGWLFAPADALENEPIIFSYLRGYLDGVTVLKEGGAYSVDGVSFVTPVRHVHGVEVYGMIFNTGQHTFSYIPDSRYFDGLSSSYNGELLIINAVRLDADHPWDHLSVPDAREIINAIRPRIAILTHFGMAMWRAGPREVAEKLSQETGVRVLAAWDGMKFDLSQLDEG